MGVVISGHGPTPEEVVRAHRKACEMRMRRAMVAVDGEVRRRAPFRTGHLRRSIAWRIQTVGRTVIGTIGTNLFYGRYLEEGTGLYGPRNRRIVPVNARALRFPAGGTSSTFSGGRRVQGSAGPGFRLSGQRRAGTGGQGANFVFARSVRGIHPRRFFRDSIEISRGAVMRELRQIPADAQRLLGRAA